MACQPCLEREHIVILSSKISVQHLLQPTNIFLQTLNVAFQHCLQPAHIGLLTAYVAFHYPVYPAHISKHILNEDLQHKLCSACILCGMFTYGKQRRPMTYDLSKILHARIYNVSICHETSANGMYLQQKPTCSNMACFHLATDVIKQQLTLSKASIDQSCHMHIDKATLAVV